MPTMAKHETITLPYWRLPVARGRPPVAVASGPANACSGQPFTITATNLVPYGTTGVTYQWQSSPSGGTPNFTNVGTAQTTPAYLATQTAATDYQLIVTCTNSALSTTSNVITVGMNTFISCYCSPTHSTGCNSFGTPYGTINNVLFDAINHSPGCGASPYYLNIPQSTATASVVPGNTYTLTINSGGYDIAGAWIDWDQDGTFATTEYFALGTSNSTSAATNKSATILVPAGRRVG